MSAKRQTYPPIHPGEILRELLEAAGISATSAATAMSIPANRLTEIAAGRRSISGDTAIRLGAYFGNSDQFWMNLQSNYELDLARYRSGSKILSEVAPLERAS